ncbi:MAG: CYTH domain-containing protein [Deltaproteobacteria bacterium]
MALEIERKYLVTGNGWKQAQGVHFIQGYLNRDKERTVRVRVEGEKATLTVKGVNCGATRNEYEYPIPVADALELLGICDGPVLEKNRHIIVCDGLTWEVDEFLGANQGLIIAEVELQSENQSFQCPEWVGQEVTGDPRYYNSNLCTHPYCEWR